LVNLFFAVCVVKKFILSLLLRSNIENAIAMMYRIAKSSELPPIPDWVSDQGKHFISRCLERDPDLRGDTEELLGHPFVAESLPSAPSSPASSPLSSPSPAPPFHLAAVPTPIRIEASGLINLFLKTDEC